MANSVSSLLQNPSFKTANSTPQTRGLPQQQINQPQKPLRFGIPREPSQALVDLSIRNSPQPVAPQATPPARNLPINQQLATANTQPNQNNQAIQQQLGDIRNEALKIQSLIPQATQPTQPVRSAPPLFDDVKKSLDYKSLVGDLAGASRPSQQQQDLISMLTQAGQGNQAIGDRAGQISDMYGREIARVGGLGAAAQAGYLSTGTNVVGAGNAAIASQSASQRMQALAQGQQAQLMGTGQQLTGQGQLASALGAGLAGANVQQQQQITGLGTAAGLAQPTQVPYSNQFLNPLTGESAGGAGLGGYAGFNAAETAIALARQYPDAGVQYDPNQTPEQNLQRIQQAVQSSPTYQRNTFGVPGQGTIAGAQAVQTAQQGYNQSFQEYNNLVRIKDDADNRVNIMLGVLDDYGITRTDVRPLNQVIADVSRRFGSAGQAAFDTALKEVQSAYSGLLSMGGNVTPTEATEASNALVSGSMSIPQILASIEQLKKAGDSRIITAGDQVNTYLRQLQAASQGGMQSGGGSSNPFAEEW